MTNPSKRRSKSRRPAAASSPLSKRPRVETPTGVQTRSSTRSFSSDSSQTLASSVGGMERSQAEPEESINVSALPDVGGPLLMSLDAIKKNRNTLQGAFTQANRVLASLMAQMNEQGLKLKTAGEHLTALLPLKNHVYHAENRVVLNQKIIKSLENLLELLPPPSDDAFGQYEYCRYSTSNSLNLVETLLDISTNGRKLAILKWENHEGPQAMATVIKEQEELNRLVQEWEQAFKQQRDILEVEGWHRNILRIIDQAPDLD